MPLSYTTDHRTRRTVATGAGVVTLADVMLYLVVCVRDQVHEFDQLIDLRRVTALAPDPEEVLHLAIRERRHLPPETVVYTALVADVETEMFAVAQHLSRGFARDGVAVRVFSSVDDAGRWLDRVRPKRKRSRAWSAGGTQE